MSLRGDDDHPSHPRGACERGRGGTVASCAKQGYFETAALVDADGVRQAVLRGDRAGSHSLDSAYDKAYTAASFKADTSALFERSKTAPGFSNLFTQLPHLILLAAASSSRGR